MAASGLKRKLEGEIEIRVAGGDVFHEICQNKPHHIANIHPELVQDCELHDGDFGKHGSMICWRYSLDGKKQSAKQSIDLVDEENKVMKLRVLEGDLLEDYNTFVVIYQVIPKDEELSLVKWTFEYEKKHQGSLEPSSLMDAMINLTKKIDDHHHDHESTRIRLN